MFSKLYLKGVVKVSQFCVLCVEVMFSLCRQFRTVSSPTRHITVQQFLCLLKLVFVLLSLPLLSLLLLSLPPQSLLLLLPALVCLLLLSLYKSIYDTSTIHNFVQGTNQSQHMIVWLIDFH